jgi:hypothetical protein
MHNILHWEMRGRRTTLLDQLSTTQPTRLLPMSTEGAEGSREEKKEEAGNFIPMLLFLCFLHRSLYILKTINVQSTIIKKCTKNITAMKYFLAMTYSLCLLLLLSFATYKFTIY